MLAGLNLVIGLLVIGLAMIVLVLVIVRVMPRFQLADGSRTVPADYQEPVNSIDAVIIVQPGGRVDHINSLARAHFGLRENEPYDLERLARRTRPADDFLAVCAVPGQRRISIGGRMMEATSYQVPGPYPIMLVSLRSVDMSPAVDGRGSETSGAVLKIVTEFSQDIATSLDVQTTVQSILQNVNRLVPADVLELKLWEAGSQTLIQHRLRHTTTAGLVMRNAPSQFGGLTAGLM